MGGNHRSGRSNALCKTFSCYAGAAEKDHHSRCGKSKAGGSVTNLLHELRLEGDLSDAGNFAVDVVITLDNADPAHLGADLDHAGRAFKLEVLDYRHGVTIREDFVHAVADIDASF